MNFLLGLELGVEYDEIYNGSWGYNSLLTGAALGGNLLVLNSQTSVATVVAIVYTVLVQYCIQSVFTKVLGSLLIRLIRNISRHSLVAIFQMDLPILTLPFVMVTSLFLKLRSNKDNATFPRPTFVSFPEKQRHDYLASRPALTETVRFSQRKFFVFSSDSRYVFSHSRR